MQRLVYFGMLIFTCALWSQEKIRVFPKDIRIEDEAIFVWLDDEWISIEALYNDPEGLFIKPSYAIIDYGFTWKCECGVWNFGSDDKCQKCRKWRRKPENVADK